MIDLNELMETAKRNKNRVALAAYQSLQTRAERAMSMPGPSQGRPLDDRSMILLVHEEIKDRHDSNEFIAPTQSTYTDNQQIISLLSKLIPR